MNDLSYVCLTTCGTDLTKKFLADVKVLHSMRLCWGISIRVRKKIEKYRNAADEILFKEINPCQSEIEIKSNFRAKKDQPQNFGSNVALTTTFLLQKVLIL